MKDLIIFGDTIVAKLAFFYFSRDSKYIVRGFAVEDSFRSRDTFFDLPVFRFETIQTTHPPSKYDMFVAVGPSKMNTIRQEKCRVANNLGYRLATYISPFSNCSSELGQNCFVGDYAVINPFSFIGENNFFWEHSIIANDCEVKSHCYFSPKSVVSSFCKVLDNSIVGTSSVVKARVTVAEQTLIGASCYISRDTEFRGVYGRKSSELLGCISDKIDISL
jgi:carbonic anhydrase/acetyltransferase-like protein (isoleucine patch superfamily)